ncbi:T-cell receptor alpha chain V region CTL-L17 [Fukomys damarensis]|nr:T-cell receptor alpha chain V region CTL-L17 [Fukomys damarensis]
MNCSFSSTFNYLLWYKQDPGEGLILLITLYKSGESKSNGKRTAQLDGTRKNTFLSIPASKPDDGGTYFCAGQHSAPQAPAVCIQT